MASIDTALIFLCFFLLNLVTGWDPRGSAFYYLFLRIMIRELDIFLERILILPRAYTAERGVV